MSFLLAHEGLGRDIWTIPFHNITMVLLYMWVMELLYVFYLQLIKLAFLFFYMRLFQSGRIISVIYVAIAVIVLTSVIFTFCSAFQCDPVNFYWNEWDGEHRGQCLDTNAIIWANAGINIVFDLFVILLPVWKIHQMNMSKRNKFQAGLMFLVGILITTISIVRLQSLVVYGRSQNPTYDLVGIVFYSMLEGEIAVFCVCMPQMRRLILDLFAILDLRKNKETSNTTPSTSQFHTSQLTRS